MTIWVAPYSLRWSQSPNAATATRDRVGALLRVETTDGFGYADLHPWPELDDEPLQRQLDLLKESHATPLTRRSLELARIDARFRSLKQNAFGSLAVPRSHFLIPDLLELKVTELDDVRSRGFDTLKIKLGRKLALEVAKLNELRDALVKFKLRFDFNGRLAPADFETFITTLAVPLREQIEFVEDPVKWNAAAWQELLHLGVPLALDRVSDAELTDQLQTPSQAYQWCVLKPAIQEPLDLVKLATQTKASVCVTSYMDHPLGQVSAAFEATRLTGTDVPPATCGLLTHLSLDQNSYADRLRVEDTRLQAPEGFGFGFTDLLEKENWKRLR